ncbi:elongation factor 1-beta [Candidatus Pacearchaeota archaeon]|nr:elongation factor 1-beta [Candidatus Pacearchaeota archaeon]
MAAVVSIIVKLMPESPSSDLETIKTEAKSRLEKEEAKNLSFEEKPIAFGLKALYIKFALDEQKGTDTIESILSTIKEVSSVTIEDYRRAFG